jgi:hypothetical protein
VKRTPWVVGSAFVAAAVAVPLLIAAPAQAADCGYGSPAPKLNTPSPTTTTQWQRITLSGTSPALCGKIGVQRQIGTGAWTTLNGVNPVKPSSSNTFSLWVELGVTGTYKLRVFYTDAGQIVPSNYRTVTINTAPTPPTPPTPPAECGDDYQPAFVSIPSRVVSGKSFKVEGTSPEVCGQVTLLRWTSGKWKALSKDTPGPLNEVFYTTKIKVPTGKDTRKRKFALSYIDEGDVVYSNVWKVVAYA